MLRLERMEGYRLGRMGECLRALMVAFPLARMAAYRPALTADCPRVLTVGCPLEPMADCRAELEAGCLLLRATATEATFRHGRIFFVT
ncbi:hypothetical protein D3C71_1787230 [compost metagenome]